MTRSTLLACVQTVRSPNSRHLRSEFLHCVVDRAAPLHSSQHFAPRGSWTLNDPSLLTGCHTRAVGDTDDVAALEQHAAAQHVLMTDADGRRFNCTVPAGGASTLQSPSKQRTDISLRSPFELLEPLCASHCCHRRCTPHPPAHRMCFMTSARPHSLAACTRICPWTQLPHSLPVLHP